MSHSNADRVHRIDVWMWRDRELVCIATVTGIKAARAVQRLVGPGLTFVATAVPS